MNNKPEIVILYTKEFVFYDTNFAASVGYKPEAGKVYRAIKDSNGYRVQTVEPHLKGEGKPNGMFISSLENDGTRCSFKFVEITPVNMSDYEIDGEDYENIQKWLLDNHKDLYALLEQPARIVDGEGNSALLPSDSENFLSKEALDLLESISKKSADIGEQMEQVVGEKRSSSFPTKPNIFRTGETLDRSLSTLNDVNPALLFVIEKFLHYQANLVLPENEGNSADPLRQLLGLSPKVGMGANLFAAFTALQHYAASEDPEALELAISYIFTELERKLKNG